MSVNYLVPEKFGSYDTLLKRSSALQIENNETSYAAIGPKGQASVKNNNYELPRILYAIHTFCRLIFRPQPPLSCWTRAQYR